MDHSKRERQTGEAILWQCIAMPGYEACRVKYRELCWQLEGMAAFRYETQPCQLRYRIICDEGWRTVSAAVYGWVGDFEVNLQIKADGDRRWWLSEVEIPAVRGCIDLDLNFSPSTNTVAIRRLSLEIGEQKELTAAWLRFPSFNLEPLPQSYRRLKKNLYRYESGGGSFLADLTVDPSGFVVDYPGAWKKDA